MTKLILFVLVLSSCSIQQNSIEKQEAEITSSLIGEQKTECVSYTSESYVLTFTFTDNRRVTLKENYFYGPSCSVEDAEWISEYTFSEEADKVIFERFHEKMTAQYVDTVNDYNDVGNEWCGI